MPNMPRVQGSRYLLIRGIDHHIFFGGVKYICKIFSIDLILNKMINNIQRKNQISRKVLSIGFKIL